MCAVYSGQYPAVFTVTDGKCKFGGGGEQMPGQLPDLAYLAGTCHLCSLRSTATSACPSIGVWSLLECSFLAINLS